MTTAQVILDLGDIAPLRQRCCVHRTTLYYRIVILELTGGPGRRASSATRLWLEAFRAPPVTAEFRQLSDER